MTLDTLSLLAILQRYLYDTIRNIHTRRYVHRPLRVQEVYCYYVVMGVYANIMWSYGTPIKVSVIQDMSQFVS